MIKQDRAGSRLLAVLFIVAFLETLTTGRTAASWPFIAAVEGEVIVFLVNALCGLPIFLLLAKLNRSAMGVAGGALPGLFALFYMAFHDRKYDLLGPFPTWLAVLAARLAVLFAACLVAVALSRSVRWKPFRYVSLALLAAGPALLVLEDRPAGTGSPGILLLTIDTLRSDALSCYGSPLVETPHLDRLSRQGTLHEQAFCQIPITTPSHASILTGLYPRDHAVRGQAYNMDRNVPLVTETLRHRGLRTAAFVSAYPLDSKFGLARGFETYDDEFADPKPPFRAAILRLAFLAWPIPRIERPARDVNRLAKAWLKRLGSEGFFLWVHYFEPHGPYQPPEPFRKLYLDLKRNDLCKEEPRSQDEREALAAVLGTAAAADDVRFARLAYAGEVAEADRAAGILLASARKARAAHHDLAVFVLADHGESLTEHGAYFRHGEDLYDPSLRIPCIVSLPGTVARLDNALFESIEIAPAIGRAAGLKQPGTKRYGLVLAESTSAAVHYRPRKVIAARTLRYKVIRGEEDRKVEAYDLGLDPGEDQNIAAEVKGVVSDLSEALDRYQEGSPGNRPPMEVDAETIRRLQALGYLK